MAGESHQPPSKCTRDWQSGISLCILSITFLLKVLKAINGSCCLKVCSDPSAGHIGGWGLIRAYFIMVATMVVLNVGHI